ncbi:hypothetical protein MAPG_05721, partial [Magnaporthiopsis poae ATCC 64411]
RSDSKVPVGERRRSLLLLLRPSGASKSRFAPSLRLALTPANMSSVLEGRVRPLVAVVGAGTDEDEAVGGFERSEPSWAEKDSELERSIAFRCRFGGGWP